MNTTKAVHFSKSFHGGVSTSMNNTLLFPPTRHTVFDGFNKELHSTPKIPATHSGYTRPQTE